MFKNYIITAWKVFLRRKFFTFINLFGISLTLMVLIVISTIAENYFYPKGPEKHADNIRVINSLMLTNEERNSTSTGRLGYKFIQDNVYRLQSPELISLNSGARKTTLFHEGMKYSQLVKKTDSNFWKILDFNFIQGRGFSDEEYQKGSFVAVINRQTQAEMFNGKSAIGKELYFDKQRFTIIGVVENVSAVEETALSDIWVPYTTNPSTDYQQQTTGGWEVMLYHSNADIIKDLNKEYVNLLKNDVLLSELSGFTSAFSGAYSKLELLSREVFSSAYSYETYTGLLVALISGLVFAFMLLPSINMVNLNISRMMERMSEIGVRRAFGASKKQLLLQFIIETVLLTLIGGIVGILLSVFILNAIEASLLIPYAQFSFNYRVLLLALLLILIFGIISGAYPAYKMSRLDPISALKGGR